MEGSIIKCPLCCDKTFDSKPMLIQHLADTIGNLSCPICSNKWSSLGHLIEHLSLDNCQPDTSAESIIFDIHKENDNVNSSEQNSDYHLEQLEKAIDNDVSQKINRNSLDPFTIVENSEATDDGSEMGKMYVELLSKQLMKPCLQTQELKLVKDNGVSRYVIMTNESDLSVGSAVVTKQNIDGTISLTTVKDMKMEADADADTVITQENDPEENQEEIYSCNTCGVSFTSVIEHIQNYHNDQDVVVEEPMVENGVAPPALDYVDGGGPASEGLSEKMTPRRMITDTGDIIEAPSPLNTKATEIEPTSVTCQADDTAGISEIKQEVDKDGAASNKHYVIIDQFCESLVQDINPTNDKSGPYHKVIVKDLQTTNGQRVKVYNCVSCNVYVATLEEFKSHPCKTLKYVCPHCPVSYENSKSLCAHMKVHKVRNGPDLALPMLISYKCEICSTVFKTNKSLKLHRRMHDPVKSRPIEPPVEAAEGTEVSQDKYFCSVCAKLIPIDYRTIHQNSHKSVDKFNCDICNKKFSSNEYLDMHMTVHSTEKVVMNKQDKSLPYRCLYCERRFARPHEKVKHERIHTGEKPHRCEICGKSFRVSYCLTLHMRTHTGARPYSCPHCGKRFKAHSVYNHHLLTHSDVRAYKCPYCPKAFKTSVQLAGHRNSHTKPFSCQHCNRPFASLYAVRVHTETHARQNNLKFSCSMCGASYARAFALKDHIKQAHNKDIDNVELSALAKEDDNIIPAKDGGTLEDIQMDKELQNEISVLEINTELIVP